MPPRKRKAPEEEEKEEKGAKKAPAAKKSKGKEEEPKGKGKGKKAEEGEGAGEATVVFSTEMPTSFSYPPTEKGRLKIVSYNLDGFQSAQAKSLSKYIEAENADVVCFQETKVSEGAFPQKLYAMYPHEYWNCSKAKKGYSGTALFSKIKPLSVTMGIGKEEHDQEGRAITAEFEDFYLVNTYVPNSGQKLERLPYRATWDADLQGYLKQLNKTKPVIWTGDLNVAHSEIDLTNPKTNKKTAGFTQQERDSFGKFLEEGFVDSFRHLYPGMTNQFTFWGKRFNARVKNLGWRLDYFVVSKALLDRVVDVIIRKEVWGASDHVPLCLELKHIHEKE